KCSKPGSSGGRPRLLPAAAVPAGAAPSDPPSDPPVNGLADEGIAVADLEEAFGMTEEEQVTGTLQPRDAHEELPLGLLVEVDHHVAAENGVQRPSHRQGVDEIELLECDERGHLGSNLPTESARFLTLGEEPRQPFRRDV